MLQIKKWYVDNSKLNHQSVRERDVWCLRTFGSFRHDTEDDGGWWLQTEEEYVLFIMRWGINN